ncbi:MAG: hypothetical protein ABI867_26930 [Kofleriaceae bacterium]
MGTFFESDKTDDVDREKPKSVDAPSGASPPPIPDKDDRLGSSARTTSPDPIKDKLDIIAANFHWLAAASSDKIGQLHETLKKEDDPPWYQNVAEALLVGTLGASTAAIGVAIASKLVKVASKEVTREFVKVLFENGINAGVAAGSQKLSGKREDVTGAFIQSQREGARKTHMENQKRFFEIERHKITTLEEASALEQACSAENLEAAAVTHYKMSRDAWLSYLAQAEFGAVGKNGAPKHGEGTATNMSNRESREKVNTATPGATPENAPDRRAVGRNEAPGVLAVAVELPGIFVDQMPGRPKVTKAVLNDVNETIRQEYEGQALDAARVPRLIVATVAGQQADFGIGIDEEGRSTYLNHQQDAWLRARAVVGHPENQQKNDYEQQQAGLKLLLREIVPTHIKRNAGLWRS